MANLSLLMVVFLAGALCVQSWTHDGKADHKKKRDTVNSFLHGMLEEEELALRKMDLETDELLETRQASGDDSDDTDESGEAEESSENEVTNEEPTVEEPTGGPDVAAPPGVAECGQPAIAPSVSVRIVGGVEAMPHSWPWQVSLQGRRGHFCGGSIINDRWIATAAHCAAGFRPGASDNRVVVGLHNLRQPDSFTQTIRVTEIIPMAKYGRPPRQNSNDIMLLKLETSITFNDAVSPVCLPKQFKPVASGRRCYSTGWGALRAGGRGPDELNQVMLPIIDRDVCNQPSWYNGAIDDSMVCAGYAQGGRDTCQGDSGGPLVCFEDGRWMLYGVVSWGNGCARANFPGLYARVSPYINWMNEQISLHS